MQKPSFSIAHGGGKLMEKNSLEYATLLQWIRDGVPVGASGGPKLMSVQLLPGGFRVLDRLSDRQQIGGDRHLLGRFPRGPHGPCAIHVERRGHRHRQRDGLVTPKRNGEVTVLIRTLGRLDAMRVAVALRPELPQVSTQIAPHEAISWMS